MNTEEYEQGRIQQVYFQFTGDYTIQSHAAAAQTIFMEDVSDFSDDGGQVQINDVLYNYDARDVALATIHLTTGLTGAIEEEERVYQYPLSEEMWATVQLVDEDDAVEARVPHGMEDVFIDEIRDPGQEESVLVEYEGHEWVVRDVIGQTLLRSGAYIDPGTLPVPPTSDGDPPLTSPFPTTQGAQGFIFLRWTAPANADFLTYEVHCTTAAGIGTPPVAGAAGTLLMTTASTMVTAKQLPDGTPFEYEDSNGLPINYYFAVIAKDADGSAPAASSSGDYWAPGQMDKTAAGDLAAGAITAAQLEAVLALVSTLSTRSKDGDGNLTGAGTDLTTAGLFSYKSDGTPRFELPNDPLLPAVFRGDAEIDNLTVKTLATLLTSELAQNAVFTLQSALSPPSNAPTIVQDWVTKQFTVGSGSWDTRYSWTSDGTYSYTWNQAYARIEKYSNSTGLRVAFSDVLTDYWGGISSASIVYDPGNSCLWLLNRTNGGFWIDKFSTALAWDSNNSYQKTQLDTNGGLPCIGFDGSNVEIIVAQSRSSDGKMVWYRYENTGSLTYIGSLVSASAYDASNMCAIRTNADFGENCMIAGSRNSNASLQVFQMTSGNNMDAYEWPTGASANKLGAYYDSVAGKFVIMHQNGKQYTYEKDGNYWTTGGQSADWQASYTWYQSTGPTQTTRSPFATFSMQKRARLKITASSKPSGVSSVRFYLRVYAANQNLNDSWYQGESTAASPTITITNATFSGTSSPATNSFGAGTPAEIKSALGDGSPYFSVKGDGSGRWGPLVFGSDGVMSGADKVVAKGTRTTDLTGYTTETHLMQVSFTAVNGAEYKVECMAPLETNTATAFSVMRTRFNQTSGGITGTVVTNQVLDHRASNRRESATGVGYFTASASGTTYVKITVDNNNTGTSPCSLNAAWLIVTRIG